MNVFWAVYSKMGVELQHRGIFSLIIKLKKAKRIKSLGPCILYNFLEEQFHFIFVQLVVVIDVVVLDKLSNLNWVGFTTSLH